MTGGRVQPSTATNPAMTTQRDAEGELRRFVDRNRRTGTGVTKRFAEHL